MFRTVVSAVALACAAASPVMGNEPPARLQGRVAYGDLDLSNPADLAKLHERIRQKAHILCTQGIDEDWHDSPQVEACEASVIASGEKRIARLSGLNKAQRTAASH